MFRVQLSGIMVAFRYDAPMTNRMMVVLMLALVGCRTEFYGSPHIDPGTCQQKCASSNLQMTGMVYMGEYSSACVCEVPRQGPAPGMSPTASAAVSGATAAVMNQMRRDEEERQQHNR